MVLFDGDHGIAAKITDTENRVRYPGICYQALAKKKRKMLLSEELRILYVAMTRPKDYLFILYTAQSPQGILERLQVGAGNPAAPWASADVKRLGDWVLLAALSRVESGELFALCGRPEGELLTSEYPWGIFVENLEGAEQAPLPWRSQQPRMAEQEIPSAAQLIERLSWKDPHQAAEQTPSKLTATQLKGRDKDQEAAEGASVKARIPQLRRPEFVLEKQGLSASERGTGNPSVLAVCGFFPPVPTRTASYPSWIGCALRNS